MRCLYGGESLQLVSETLCQSFILIAFFFPPLRLIYKLIPRCLSLLNDVFPIGGIKEKLIGALSAGVKTVLLPAHNRKEVRELPDEVRSGLEIIYVR